MGMIIELKASGLVILNITSTVPYMQPKIFEY